MVVHTDNVWKDIELIIDPDPFSTSCQISSMNKKDMSKNPLKPNVHFKWFLMGIITATGPKHFRSDTTFTKYFLIFDAYSKIKNIYVMEKITKEEVMDKLDTLQSRFGKIDEFGWWDLKNI